MLLAGACGDADGGRPPVEAQDAIRAVAETIAPCVHDAKRAMERVSVVQFEGVEGSMMVTLSDGAAFSVGGGSAEPQPANTQAESLLAACP